MTAPLPTLEPFPDDFPHKGEFIAWDLTWNRTGHRSTPQYPGQMPINFPEDATPYECFIGGYLRVRA